MKLFHFTKHSDYLKAKEELIKYASTSNLHPLKVYKIASAIEIINSKRSKYKTIGISSSIVFGSLIASLSLSIGTKLLIVAVGTTIIIVACNSLKDRESIMHFKKLLEIISELKKL